MFPVAHLDGAVCADPQHLELVDAAFVAPGGEPGQRMRKELCARCPIWSSCLTQGMAGEWGVWGGTSPHQRTRHGAPKAVDRIRSTTRVA